MMTWRDELYHYGINGMKWGIRRYQYEDGSLTPEGVERYSKKGLHSSFVRRYWNEDGSLTPAGQERHAKTVLQDQRRAVKKERREAYANRRMMTDEELAERVKRLEMEKRFRDLTQGDISPGQKVALNIVKKSGDILLNVAINDAYSSVKGAVTKKINKDKAEAAKIVAERQKQQKKPKKPKPPKGPPPQLIPRK